MLRKGEKRNTETDRKKIGEQLVNVVDYLCFSQGIRTLFILHFQVTVAANNFTST